MALVSETKKSQLLPSPTQASQGLWCESLPYAAPHLLLAEAWRTGSVTRGVISQLSGGGE